MYSATPVWTTPGGTLSDKSARKEFGLTQEEIVEAIRAGELQARHNSMHGNPYYKLLRHEVEAFVCKKYGDDYMENKRLSNELAQVKRDLRKFKKQITVLEKRKVELEVKLGK